MIQCDKACFHLLFLFIPSFSLLNYATFEFSCDKANRARLNANQKKNPCNKTVQKSVLYHQCGHKNIKHEIITKSNYCDIRNPNVLLLNGCRYVLCSDADSGSVTSSCRSKFLMSRHLNDYSQKLMYFMKNLLKSIIDLC